jgi:hypothetical protein
MKMQKKFANCLTKGNKVKQLIFDIETMGTESQSVMLCASFLVYDLLEDATTPVAELEDRIRTFKLNVAEQIQDGGVIEPSTVEWWGEQLVESPHLNELLHPQEYDLTMEEFAEQLEEWLKAEGYDKRNDWAWQRGTLDITVVDSIMKRTGRYDYDRPIFWWKIREIRTLIDILGAGRTRLNGYVDGIRERVEEFIPHFTKHNPAHDILMEVVQMREVGYFPTEELK